MLSRGETIGVFQVESAGMRKALIGMRPDCIEDIIALVALYRPGPMENIPVYNARKHGEEELESIHPTIDHLLKETQGVIVYQEQVMQIAQVLSGYSLGEADLLRRAMGKKIKEEMDQQRERFVDGAIKNGVSKPQANTIFDLLAKFANYGFNKSHAAAYAIVSYQTAYMKAHYPVEFLAASMTLDMANTEKLNDFRQDAGRLGIEVVAPSVQTSFRQFETGENRIYYSLAAIKGVGEGAVEHIVQVRDGKPFTSLEDFCLRIDPKQINRRVLESLINAGAFDCFGRDRAELIGGLDRIIGYAQMAQNNRTIGQSDMFGSGGGQARKSSFCRRSNPGCHRKS
ncbi:bacterial DNA polymerase III alpha subunit domain-containing protein [Ditylenchus destructor]|nr:bacterial DNA polymerase III alpha subunit domain-containing protein [Ditylenchus destructor]